MKILLDTHAFLWFVEGCNKLSPTANSFLSDTDNELFLSIASVWEMQIKVSIGKLKLAVSLSEIVTNQKDINDVQILAVELEHIWQLDNLQHYHKDPFDRMLIAQAKTESIPIISIDGVFNQYPVQTIW